MANRKNIHAAIDRDKSVLLFGARQTSKTTLIERIPADIKISFAIPQTRQQYEKNPDLLFALPWQDIDGLINA